MHLLYNTTKKGIIAKDTLKLIFLKSFFCPFRFPSSLLSCILSFNIVSVAPAVFIPTSPARSHPASALCVFRLVSSTRPSYIPGMPATYGPHSSWSAERPTAPHHWPCRAQPKAVLLNSVLKITKSYISFSCHLQDVQMQHLQVYIYECL